MLLSKKFFEKKARITAKELIGKIIEYNGIKGIITETEAYENDEASHAFKKTKRSELMYDTYGNIYVYMIYGFYHCLNITCDKNGPGAVLIRKIKPLNDIDENELDGPGKLCRALNITKEINGTKINDKVKIYDSNYKFKINKGSRIGIRKANNLQWRFFI